MIQRKLLESTHKMFSLDMNNFNYISSTQFQNTKNWIDQNDRCVENDVINVSICGNHFTLNPPCFEAE